MSTGDTRLQQLEVRHDEARHDLLLAHRMRTRASGTARRRVRSPNRSRRSSSVAARGPGSRAPGAPPAPDGTPGAPRRASRCRGPPASRETPAPRRAPRPCGSRSTDRTLAGDRRASRAARGSRPSRSAAPRPRTPARCNASTDTSVMSSSSSRIGARAHSLIQTRSGPIERNPARRASLERGTGLVPDDRETGRASGDLGEQPGPRGDGIAMLEEEVRHPDDRPRCRSRSRPRRSRRPDPRAARPARRAAGAKVPAS